MKHYFDVVFGEKGALANASVTVVDPATGNVVPIYSDGNGTPVPNNAVVTDADGNYDFYVVDGVYNLEFRYGGQLLKVVKNVGIYDPVGPQGPQGVAGTPGLNGATASNITIGLFTAASGQDLTAGGTKPPPEYVITSGYRTRGDVGPARYRLWSNTLPALPSVNAGENAWWFTDSQGNKYYPDHEAYLGMGAFGLYGNATFDNSGLFATGTDDLPAWKAFISWVKWIRKPLGVFNGTSGSFAAVPRVWLPFCAAYSSDTWEIQDASIHLTAHNGGAQNGGWAFTLVVAAGKTGMRVDSYDTTGLTTRTSGIGAMGSQLDNIRVMSVGDGGVTTADGFHIRGQAFLNNCSAYFFVRDGLHIEATLSVSGEARGNADLSRVVGGAFQQNGRNGITIEGSEVNVTTITSVSCTQNGQWGWVDNSMLGVTWIGCHSSTNGMKGIVGPNYTLTTPVLPTTCLFGGGVGAYNRYAVVSGQEAAASTTTPGTNANVWYLMGTDPGSGDPINYGTAIAPKWQSGMSWASGGAYYLGAAASVALGCYTETGENPVQGSSAGGSGVIIGGQQGAGYFNVAYMGGLGGPRSQVDMLGFRTSRVAPTSGKQVRFEAGTHSDDSFFEIGHGSIDAVIGQGNNAAHLGYIVGDGRIGLFDTDSRHLFSWPSYAAAAMFGKTSAADSLGVLYISAFALGASTSAARTMTSGSAAPTTGYHALGEIVWNNATAGGGPLGWYCTVAGTPGTWVAFGLIGAIGYTTGAGGTVTQATSKATGVTLNKACGQITLNNAALAANTAVSFTLTNSQIAATDVVKCAIASGATPGAYIVMVDAVGAGTCQISVRNLTAGSLGEALVLNYAVIKSVAA